MQGRRIEAFRGEQARLPAIAPRSEAPDSVSNVPPEAQRNRLPPRSRSGCWTCRTRKVKCDEQRPSCGQCLRLGHSCDYNPRLAFKDDTPRIVERMQDVSTVGSYVWDPAMSDTVPREISRGEDHLPPFPQLTSDEEREQKAELRKPGTYHVVSNPSSFERLPEYCDELSSLPRITQGSTHSNIDLDNTADDQTTVILKVFEKSARKPLTQQSQTHMGSFSASVHGLEVAGLRTLAPIERYTSSDSLSLLNFAGTGVPNVELLRHYRVTISPSIFRTGVSEGYEDVFETQARTYPPLFHAIMALSALIMAQRTGVRSADALEHYQQVIPALKAMVRCSQDSYSDGALFTHFILLVYEVIAWDHQESSMWQQHSNQLLRIITLRRQANGLEPHDFVVWALCIIDIQALLSASGDGTFAEVVLKEGLLPSPEKRLAPSTPLQSHPFHLEHAYFPALIEVNQDVLSLALKVGQMARDTRAQVARASDTIPVGIHAGSQFVLERRLRIQNLQNLVLRSQNNWRSQYPDFWTWLSGSEALPDRMFASAKYSYLFVLLLVIYSHTSMFPGQLMDQNLSSDSHASACATEIIQVARLVLSQERFEVRCTVLPLFMAAVATKDPGEKEAAMELLRVIETYAKGGSTESVRMLLQTIYEEQRVATIQKGHANSVDWISVMELSGLRVII